MSDKLPVGSGIAMARFLEKRGFRRVRQRGSHIILAADDESYEITVPAHRELGKGTLRTILRQADISREEFIRAMRAH